MRLKFVYAAFAAMPLTLMAFSHGPPIRRTGVIDGAQDCAGCHASFRPANSDARGSVKLEGLVSYSPGLTQNIKVTVSHPDAVRWGFQLTARFVSGGAMAGSFVPVDSVTKVVCDSGNPSPFDVGLAGPCSANLLSWIEHADAPRTPSGAGYSFQFQWVPPAQENGDIVFYFAGNAANGNDANDGDRIYTSSQRISLSGTASCSISRKPTVRTAVNAAAHAGDIAPNAMVEIYGSDFQVGSRTRIVGAGDLGSGAFPKELSCIAVEIDGQRAPVTYVQQDQINIQAPTSTKTGPVSLVVFANPGRPNELRSDVATINMQAVAPAFFTFDGKSIAAQIAGKADIVANSSVVPGASPAKPGDLVTLYGSGWGATTPAAQAGAIPSGAAPLAGTSTLTIGGISVPASDILYVGLAPQSISGLYQMNVRIPAAAPDGDLPVIFTTGGVASAATSTIPVKK